MYQVLHALCALSPPVSHAQGTLVPHLPSDLRTVVPRVPRVLRFLLPHVLRAVRAFVSYVLSALHAFMPHLLCVLQPMYLKCLVLYVFLYLKCSYALRILAALQLACFMWEYQLLRSCPQVAFSKIYFQILELFGLKQLFLSKAAFAQTSSHDQSLSIKVTLSWWGDWSSKKFHESALTRSPQLTVATTTVRPTDLINCFVKT